MDVRLKQEILYACMFVVCRQKSMHACANAACMDVRSFSTYTSTYLFIVVAHEYPASDKLPSQKSRPQSVEMKWRQQHIHAIHRVTLMLRHMMISDIVNEKHLEIIDQNACVYDDLQLANATTERIVR